MSKVFYLILAGLGGLIGVSYLLGKAEAKPTEVTPSTTPMPKIPKHIPLPTVLPEVPEPTDEQMASGHFYLTDQYGNKYEYRFVEYAPVMPWATKGFWEYGKAGGLLAPITVAMARYRYEYGIDKTIPLKIAEWYKENYPDLW